MNYQLSLTLISDNKPNSDLDEELNLPKLFYLSNQQQNKIIATVTKNESLYDVLTNPAHLEELITNAQAMEIYYGEKHFDNLIEQITTNPHFLTEISEIYINGQIEHIKDYIKANPMLQKMSKIKIVQTLSLNIKEVQNVLHLFSNLPNIFIKLEGNTEYISLEEYQKTALYIMEIVKQIKSLKLSPFENYIYVYDYIRKRSYNKENFNETYEESRDLTRVIFGNKIVCVGFANFASALLNQLNLPTSVFYLKCRDNSGHARPITYLVDSKYNLQGLYFADPTFGSKKANNTQTYMDDYKFIAKTYQEMKRLDKHQYQRNSYPYFEEEAIIDISEQYDEQTLYELLSTEDFLSHFHFASNLTNLPKIPFIELTMTKIIDRLYEIYDLANKPIDPTVFARALYTVRKIEYYENPTTYKLNIQKLIQIIKNAGFSFQKRQSSQYAFFLDILEIQGFITEEEAGQIISNIDQEKSIKKEILRLDLTRCLKKLSQTKK